MTVFLAPAQAPSPAAPSPVGVSASSLLGSLGAGAAAVVVTSYFIGFLKERGQDHKRVLAQFTGYHAKAQQNFKDQLDRLIDHYEALQQKFQEQVNRSIEAHDRILRDALGAMKSIEETMGTSTATIQAIQQTVDSLRLAVRALNVLVQHATGEVAADEPGFPPEDQSS
jgi:hypothetical protein